MMAKTVDELFEEIGRSLGTTEIATRIGNYAGVGLAAGMAEVSNLR